MRIKSYKLFLEKEENSEFEFLVNVGKLKIAIIKIVEVHENHYYHDTKMSTSVDFKQAIGDLIDKCLVNNKTYNKNSIQTENFLQVIKMFENRIYNNNLFLLWSPPESDHDVDSLIDNDNDIDESMFGVIDDIILPFNELIRSDDKDEDDIKRFGNDIEHIMKIDDTWVYQQSMDETRDQQKKALDEIGEIIDTNIDHYVDKNGIWNSEEEFEKDMLDFIGKPMKDFDYSDRLQAYKYIENKPWVKSVMDGDSEEDKDFIRDFLSQIKDNFGI